MKRDRTTTQFAAALENVLLEIIGIRHRSQPVPRGEEIALLGRCAQLGEQINARGGFDLMQEVLDSVTDRHPAYADLMLTICDKRWDGIGHWVA
ncbi:hypothetical protein BRAS3843_720016 [Bradyrhizobium sp. STM 3843]|uniref:hypothetical protein n=1 Tax=Bradyrhizobium sp. STM 3843 TaxID=551947 RepID=UPI0002403D94|nr:hypothetical protein [Bradyrhizobium sp. STM 3843]CCE11556.1 hypothetical protein BRAS3843_720016 [Bradyrhizobium sp. STM 3843]